MKLKNILSILCVFFVAMSCSMEDDILKEGSNNVKQDGDTEAYVSFNLSLSEMTKTQEEPASTNEKAIQNVTLFLLDRDGNVLAVKTAGANDDYKNVKFLTKVTNGAYEVLAVVNNNTDLTSKKSKNAINEAALNENDLNALVKVGSSLVVFPANFEGSSALTGVTLPVHYQTIKVHQIAARIELGTCTVKGFTAGLSDVNVSLVNVQLSNINKVSYVDKDADQGHSYKEDNKSLNVTLWENGQSAGNGRTNKNKPVFYSFRNTNGTPIEMSLTFQVGNNTPKTRTFIINGPNSKTGADHNYVKAGYLYRLNVTVNVQGEDVEPTFTCSVLDWDRNFITGDLEQN